jgi:hypothetical protein
MWEAESVDLIVNFRPWQKAKLRWRGFSFRALSAFQESFLPAFLRVEAHGTGINQPSRLAIFAVFPSQPMGIFGLHPVIDFHARDALESRYLLDCQPR